MDRRLVELGIAETGASGIGPGAADRRALALDAEQAAAFPCQRDREVAHAAEEVEDRFLRAGRGQFDDGGDQPAVLFEVDLAETAGLPAQRQHRSSRFRRIGDGKAVADLRVTSGGGGEGKIPAGEEDPVDGRRLAAEYGRLVEIAGPRPPVEDKDADRAAAVGIGHDLQFRRLLQQGGTRRVGAEGGEGPVDIVAGDQASCHRHDLVAVKAAEAGPAPGIDLQADALAVAESEGRGQRFGEDGRSLPHRRLGMALEQIADDRFFERELAGVIAVLQVAAAAGAVVGAGRLDPPGMRSMDSDRHPFDERFPFPLDTDIDGLTGQGQPDHGRPAVVETAQAVAAVDHFANREVMDIHFPNTDQWCRISEITPGIKAVGRSSGCRGRPARILNLSYYNILVLSKPLLPAGPLLPAAVAAGCRGDGRCPGQGGQGCHL